MNRIDNEDELYTEIRHSRRRGTARPRHHSSRAEGTQPAEPRTTESRTAEFRQADPRRTEPRTTDHRTAGAGPAQKTERRKKHPILLILLGVLLLGAGGLVFAFLRGGMGKTEQAGYYTVAVFGVDSRSGRVGKEALSDVNVIARFDMKTGEIKLVSMYRDTYSQISEDGKFHKLNEAFFKGGPEQAIWAVEHNTDIHVDDYAAFNWKAIADAINILGGIDLEITDAEFKYINAFITETVNSTGVGSHQLEHAGMNHLDGIQAVAYARLRLMDTDFNRTERQRKVVKLAFEKAKQADFLTLNNILVTVMPQISTSVTPDDMLPFARNISHFYIGETAGFPFDKQMADIGKLDCVIPVTLESNAVALHAFLYPDLPYEPSASLHEISERIIRDSGFGGSGETSVKTDGPVSGGNGGNGGGSSGGSSAGSSSAGGSADGAAESPAGEANADGAEATGESETGESESEDAETGESETESGESSEPTGDPEAESTETASGGNGSAGPGPVSGSGTAVVISAPKDSSYEVSGSDGSSIDDAVVVSPAAADSSGSRNDSAQGPGPGSSGSGNISMRTDGPGSPGSSGVGPYSADTPGAVSGTPDVQDSSDGSSDGSSGSSSGPGSSSGGPGGSTADASADSSVNSSADSSGDGAESGASDSAAGE